MHKKIQGQGREKDVVDNQMKSAKQEFMDSLVHLKSKK